MGAYLGQQGGGGWSFYLPPCGVSRKTLCKTHGNLDVAIWRQVSSERRSAHILGKVLSQAHLAHIQNKCIFITIGLLHDATTTWLHTPTLMIRKKRKWFAPARPLIQQCLSDLLAHMKQSTEAICNMVAKGYVLSAIRGHADVRRDLELLDAGAQPLSQDASWEWSPPEATAQHLPLGFAQFSKQCEG